MAATGTPTPNIGLRIPQGTDPASVDDINYNSNLLDTKLGAVGNTSVQDQIDSLNSKTVKFTTETITTDASGRAYIGKPQYKVLSVSVNNIGYWCYTRYADNGTATLVYVKQLDTFTPVAETSLSFSYSYID